MLKLLFVCTGNTCRGIMAAAMFEKMLKEAQIDDVMVETAGLAASEGALPAKEAINAMGKKGIDISGYRAKPLTNELLKKADFIVCMSEAHRNTLRLTVDPVKIISLSRDILDPDGGDAETYSRCASEIARCLPELFIKRVAVRAVPMAEEHIKDVVELEEKYFSHPWTEENIRSELSNDTARFFVAVAGGKVIGYIGANNNFGEVYITDIAVDGKARHRGAAMVLMNKLVCTSYRDKADFISLEVRKSNINAVSFYKICGFTVQGERPGFYTAPEEDAIIMTKKLK